VEKRNQEWLIVLDRMIKLWSPSSRLGIVDSIAENAHNCSIVETPDCVERLNKVGVPTWICTQIYKCAGSNVQAHVNSRIMSIPTETITNPGLLRDVVHTIKLTVLYTTWAGPQLTDYDNHWTIDLHIADGKFIRLNMYDRGDLYGKLSVTRHNYQSSLRTILSWSFPPRANLQVGTIYNLIIANRRHMYVMAGGGSGCRHWV
jgi:hypothetical protein